ncbi:MAG: haloacid dehalogenase-like hydrolase [bacterium]|nr:haloacid dehalogenase-like hydrolase [bacterium]
MPAEIPKAPPLFVDLDGTLVATDTLWVGVGTLVRKRPWELLILPFVVLRGRAAFKEYIAGRVTIDVSRLPYRENVLEFLRDEKSGGRTLVLATAAHREVAVAVARHVGIFDDIIASDGTRNQKGSAKLVTMLERAPGGVFDYIGDSTADLPILRAARVAHLVCPSPRLRNLVESSCALGKVFE